MKACFFWNVTGILAAACLGLMPPDAVAQSSDAAAEPKDAQAWLQRLEQRSDRLRSLQTRFRYVTVQGLVGDSQTRFGTLQYLAGPPPMFHVHFTGRVEGESLKKQNEHYIFDGYWLAEIDAQDKTFTRRQLVPEGQTSDASMFDMTSGQFPLPLQIDAERLQQRYDVSLVEPAQPAPDSGKELENTVQLKLTARSDLPKSKQPGYSPILLWFDRGTRLPVFVQATDAGGAGDELFIRFFQSEADVELPRSMFGTLPPQDDEWQVEIVPIESGPPAAE